MDKLCTLNPAKNCAGSFCVQDRTYLGLTFQTNGGDGRVVDEFCLLNWTPQQLESLRQFIDKQNREAVKPFTDLLLSNLDEPAHAPGKNVSLNHSKETLLILFKKMPARHLRAFYLLHHALGPVDLRSVYSLHTIRAYRRELRNAGFDFPRRPHIPGPGRPKRSQDKAAVVDLRASSNTAL